MKFTLAAFVCLIAGAMAATVPGAATGDHNVEAAGCPGQSSCEYRCYVRCKNDSRCYNSCSNSCACHW
ncbi:hypothetical protein BC828DRAFT_409533 [Blastocladiella britannica]|nr:hypothetical protein BC828DRAFT_409533 [Blastocladiella britannica]